MDALSTTHPVSSLLPKSFISTNLNNPLHLLKPPPPSNTNLNPPHPLSTKASHSLTPLSTSLPTFSPTLALKPALQTHRKAPTFSPTLALKPALQTHRKAATRYAAALLDVAYCDNVLNVVTKDARKVKRIVQVVFEDERVEEKRKGKVVRRAVEGGGFYVKLVVLVRMLMGKGKVRVVWEVMEEFGRLWEELCGVKRSSRRSLAL